MINHKAIINRQLDYLIANVVDVGASKLILDILEMQADHIRDQLNEAFPDTKQAKGPIPVLMFGDHLTLEMTDPIQLTLL